MAKQYGTYIAAPSIDWGKAIGGISKALEDIGLEREKQILYADDLAQKANASIKSIEGIKTQSLQEYITTGATKGRDIISQANKQRKAGLITDQQYKSILNNMMTDWSTMGNNMKNFDATNQELLKRQAEDKASAFETYLSSKHANLADLRNRFYTFSTDGHGYMAQVNASGEVEVAPSMALADPMNLMDEKIDFDKLISADTKSIGDFIIQSKYNAQGSTKINNPLENANVKETVNSLINKYTNSHRMAAQVLTTYGEDYDFYETDSEKMQLINNYKTELKKEDSSLTDQEIDLAAKQYEKQLIGIRLTDNNKYEPVLSEEQSEEARRIMKAQIESRFDYSETQSRPVTPRQPRAAKAKSISQTAKNANSTVSELNNILSAGPSKKGALSLTELIGDTGNLQVRFENGAYKLYKFDGDAFPINPNTGFEDKSKGKGTWKLKQNLGTKVNDYKGIFGFDTPDRREYWNEAVKNL
jgi:hypothetical protein